MKSLLHIAGLKQFLWKHLEIVMKIDVLYFYMQIENEWGFVLLCGILFWHMFNMKMGGKLKEWKNLLTPTLE